MALSRPPHVMPALGAGIGALPRPRRRRGCPACAGHDGERRRLSMARLCAALSVLLCLVAPPAFAAPDVVVSIKPIHALVAGVMADVGEPGLVVAGGTSPHLYTLRPRDAEALEHAALVFWVGPTMEGFLIRPLQALAANAEIVELDRARGVSLLPARHGGAWEGDEDEPAGQAGSGALEQDGH